MQMLRSRLGSEETKEDTSLYLGEKNMVRETVKITNPAGLILQWAGRLCEEASHYKATVKMIKGGIDTDAKSLLAVLGACIQYGDEVEFICEGEDEKDALEAMLRLTKEI